MKSFSLAAFLGLAAVLTGCGTAHSTVQSNASTPMKSPLMQTFVGFGDVIQTAKGVQVTVSADTLFMKKSSRLSKAGTAIVDEIAAAILKYPGNQVMVTAYTDNRGTDMKNVAFSQRRADRVKKELIRLGVLTDSVSAVGNGPVEPVAPNDTPEGKAKNRRIVFDISAS
jgi:outer membrane protein OmpA-like peptidoglycan-associated protein